MMWNDILVALSLCLVFIGILPFLKPEQWRSLLDKVIQQSDGSLRFMGLSFMLSGAAILYLIR